MNRRLHRWKVLDKSFAELESTVIFSMAKEYQRRCTEIVQPQPWKTTARALESLAFRLWKYRSDHRVWISRLTRVALHLIPYLFTGLSISVCVVFGSSPWIFLGAFVIGVFDAFALVLYTFFPTSSYELHIIRRLFIVLRWGLWVILVVGLLFLYGPLIFGQKGSLGFFAITSVLFLVVCVLCHMLQPNGAWITPSVVLGIRELQRSRITLFEVISVALLSVGVWMSFNDWNPWCKGAGFALSVFAAQAVASMASVRSQCGLVANQVKESISDVCGLLSHKKVDIVSIEQAFLRLDAALGADILNRIPVKAPVCSDEFRYIVSRCGLALVHPYSKGKDCELRRLVKQRQTTLADSYSTRSARRQNRIRQQTRELDERIGRMSQSKRRDVLMHFLHALFDMVSL